MLLKSAAFNLQKKLTIIFLDGESKVRQVVLISSVNSPVFFAIIHLTYKIVQIQV